MEETKQTKSVEMSAEELAAFRAFQQDKAKKEAEAKKKADLQAYRTLVDEALEKLIPDLEQLSEILRAGKQHAVDLLRSAVEMKREVLGLKDEGQYSHQFSNTDGDKRITLGTYTTDGYLDTVNEGIEMVTQYIESLALDDKSRALVKMVMRLLAKDNKGNLKASRLVQLRKVAEESGDEHFMAGVKLIEDSYRPNVSRLFIRAEVRDKNGAWRKIPLNVTEVESDSENAPEELFLGKKEKDSAPSEASENPNS